jgi:hypothetical protein
MEGRISEWQSVEIVLSQPATSQLSVKEKRKGSRYQVQLKLGTRHIKDSLHKEGKDRAESTGCPTQSEVEVKQKNQI